MMMTRLDEWKKLCAFVCMLWREESYNIVPIDCKVQVQHD